MSAASVSPAAALAHAPFHVMAKAIGPICNLDCSYCFYLEKERLYPKNENFKMAPDVLERFIRQYIEAQPGDHVSFAWQGGEPTLLGVDFFKRVVALQAEYAGGKTIENAFQTNGTLLDDAWGAFLAEHKFLVGLSIDGPAALHDAYRVDKKQRPTFDKVMGGLAVLKKHQVEFNTLTVVNRQNSKKPLEVYQFLKGIGSRFMQFIPLVERKADAKAAGLGLDLATPPVLDGETEEEANSPVTPWSVRADDFGEFLVQIFNRWVVKDIGRYSVQLHEVALGTWAGIGPTMCVFSERCGNATALEHNGDLFSCDHYVYPDYRLGNVRETTLAAMLNSAQQRKFGNDKADTLPRYCRTCEVRFACNGDCPKHRFAVTPEGESGLSYLCPAYKRFFGHIDPYMRVMADLVRNGQPAALLMDLIRAGRVPAPR